MGPAATITADAARGIVPQDYAHEFTSADVTAFSEIIGGDLQNNFYVWQTGSDAVDLDSGKGSTIFNIFGGDPTTTGPLFNVDIADTRGNKWNEDRIIVYGMPIRNNSIEEKASKW